MINCIREMLIYCEVFRYPQNANFNLTSVLASLSVRVHFQQQFYLPYWFAYLLEPSKQRKQLFYL
jgi:hypothetical protein